MKRPSPRFLRLLCYCLSAGLWAGAGMAAPPSDTIVSPSAAVAVEDPPIFPLNQIRRGQKGHGFTVFASARGPERFDFEILGVMHSYLGPGEDLIIAQLKGEQIERTGVISGMSGSPAYIDGKLVGAVGYRFGKFTKDAIAGITPIERMLAVKDDMPGQSASRASQSSSLSTPWGVGEPISTPLVANGMSAAVVDAFAPQLKARGYWPILPAASGGGGSLGLRKGGTPERLYASGPIAGLLVDGDVSMAGIGTVTWVKGNRFLAFGHPFQAVGQSQMPISNAEILTTVASPAGSWKMGQATTPVGRLTDDRLHAIAGNMGQFPSTVKMTVHLDLAGPRSAKDARKTLHFSVIHHPTDTPLFCALSLANSLSSRIGSERGGTVLLSGSIHLSTGDIVNVDERAANKAGNPSLMVAVSLLSDLSTLTDSGLEDVEVEAIDLKVTRIADVEAQVIRSVDATRSLRVGDQGTVRVRLSQWEHGTDEKTLSVHLPRGLRPGRWILVAAGQAATNQLRNEAGETPQPHDFGTLLQVIKDTPSPGSVSLYLVGVEQGLRIDGQGIPALPSSLRGLLSEGGGWSGKVLETHVVPLGTLEIPGMIHGQARAKVRVLPAIDLPATNVEAR